MIFHIKEAREKAGYSQKDLAKIIGVAPNTFYGYESGLHDPKSDLLVKIAIACHVSTDFLLGNESYKESASPSPRAMQIARAYDRADERDQHIVDTTLEPYMDASASKGSCTKLA